MDNSIRLSVGLAKNDPVWKLLLDQIGVHWEIIQLENSFSSNDYSLIIINDELSPTNETRLLNYAQSGGAVLFTTKSVKRIQERSKTKQYLSSLPPQQHDEYSFNAIFDIAEETFLFENELLTTTDNYEKGFLSYIGIDIDSIVLDAQSQRKSFYSLRTRLPHERVARKTKNALRQIIQSHLEFLHRKKNIPFIHKWFYPKNEQTLFTFRIDSDKGTKEQIEEIFQLSEQHHIPTTWFLDVKSHEEWLDYFVKFENQEIAVHCYNHIVYDNVNGNKENFAKAFHLIQQRIGKTANGIAAPTGEWNAIVGNTLHQIGIKYSSEFGYDYDNLPSYPILQSTVSSVLQLPVHPNCIGTMLREQMTVEEMIAYYKNYIDENIELREPICLYHHPTHKTNEVFDEIFRIINEKNILKFSYNDYADWWKVRETSSIQVRWKNETIHFDSPSNNDSWIRIVLPNQTETIVQPKSEIHLKDLSFKQISLKKQFHGDIIRTRKTTVRHYLQNVLDWWFKATE